MGIKAKKPQGTVVRYQQGTTVGVFKGRQRRERQQAELGLNEIDVQYHIAINGTASLVPAFATIDLDFEFEFHSAPGNRPSDLLLPHFNFGADIYQGGPLMVSCHVSAWDENPDNGGITGADVSIGVQSATSTPEEFAGFAHLTFQGYAVSLDDMEDNPDLIESDWTPRSF